MTTGLTAAETGTIRRTLRPWADRIERVVLFGSRATGSARVNSDIDLALQGGIGEDDIARLWTLFDDGDLPVSVDLIAYGPDLYPPLRAHIDAVGVTLFDRAALTAAD